MGTHYAANKREVTFNATARRWAWTPTSPSVPTDDHVVCATFSASNMAAIGGKAHNSRTVRSLNHLGASSG
jgi:hypothetical protein